MLGNRDGRMGKRCVAMMLALMLLWWGGNTGEAAETNDAGAAAGAEATGNGEPTEALTAIVTMVSGKHVQYSADEGASWQGVSQGLALAVNAVVRTGFASGCEISFRENSILQVEALSSVRIAEYLGNKRQEKVRVNLQYGAVRCAVEKGRIASDTQVSTPVAVLSIRGTQSRAVYDRGTNQYKVFMLRDTADVSTPRGRYRLGEGMGTDGKLSRHLRKAIFDRSVFVTGNVQIGGVTGLEAYTITQVTGASDLRGEDSIIGGEIGESGGSDGGSGGSCPDGECDPGPAN